MTPNDDQGPVYWACRRIEAPGNPGAVRRRLGMRPDAVILESVAVDGVSGRWSIYAAGAVRAMGHRAGPTASDPFDDMAAAMRPWRRLARPCPLPFVGGWIGYLSYEAGRWIEPTAGGRHALTAFGLACWRLYDTVLIRDALRNEWWVAGIELPDSDQRLEDRLCALELETQRCEGRISSVHCEPPCRNSATQSSFSIFQTEDDGWNLSRAEYTDRVETIKDYLRAGDIYQANLTRRLRTTLHCDPFRLYEATCDANPAAYAAFLRLEDGSTPRTLISSSPELFLKLESGIVTTRPIKGTRPRIGDPVVDEQARRELVTSDKERAELNMIIDLERNDLGRVCRYGSVEVVNEGEIEAHPTVFHRTATIRGALRDECDAIDLLRATFPGGSITGAPKVRAMQIIDELEPAARGPYCGAIGYVGVDGRMQLNLPIRTMTTVGTRLELAVGSGIVIGSEPDAEYEESGAKAEGMLRAVRRVGSKEPVHA